jgi:hypothetical protein
MILSPCKLLISLPPLDFPWMATAKQPLFSTICNDVHNTNIMHPPIYRSGEFSAPSFGKILLSSLCSFLVSILALRCVRNHDIFPKEPPLESGKYPRLRLPPTWETKIPNSLSIMTPAQRKWHRSLHRSNGLGAHVRYPRPHVDMVVATFLY